MKDILDEIVAWKRHEVEQQKDALPKGELYAAVEKMMADGIADRSMSKALNADAHGIIAEFKRKSPSKGWIKEEGKPEIIPPSYEQNGATALSILTDERFFGGSMEFLKTARPLVSIPILRKDFIIDEYQLFQARQIGADAVLLIAADLKKNEVKSLTSLAHNLKLEVLLEMHSLEELDYAELDVDMLGINNRNLGTFHTDVQNSFSMISRLPQDKVKVSESGINNPEIIRMLREVGYRGFLMGEYFMKQDNPGQALSDFISLL
ncbi:MAG: indole-3-glycerol phosphate synthase TrpC [Bacteroidaceae bacterium]|nr:indole-3-glycerol phosphate synthase TrpC [Bacteroidaceae bacterium]